MFSNLTIKKGDAYAFPGFVFMKRISRVLSIIIICVLICGLFAGCGSSENVQDLSKDEAKNPVSLFEEEEAKYDEPSEFEAEETIETEQETDDLKLVETFGRGINIGNSLDCIDNNNYALPVTEVSWGNPIITKTYVDSLVDAGFKTIRIPVTWEPHIYNGIIDEVFMNRVQEVVDYAYEDGAYVILDMHHDKKLVPSYDNYNFAKEYLEMVWGQVADRFKEYDEKLIFEGINEPRFLNSPDEWTEGTPEGADNVNKLMADFVNVIRKSGGNNEDRLLLITCYCNRAESTALERLVIPEDENLAVAVHTYDPYFFTSSTSPIAFDDSFKQQLEYTFQSIREYKKMHDVPIIVTEWGVFESVGKEGRIEYIKHFLNSMDEMDIPCVWWDNGLGYGDNAFSLFDRTTGEALDRDIVEAFFEEN